ncbi:unnamed protein product, partial [Didymodactylos carnosus]
DKQKIMSGDEGEDSIYVYRSTPFDMESQQEIIGEPSQLNDVYGVYNNTSLSSERMRTANTPRQADIMVHATMPDYYKNQTFVNEQNINEIQHHNNCITPDIFDKSEQFESKRVRRPSIVIREKHFAIASSCPDDGNGNQCLDLTVTTGNNTSIPLSAYKINYDPQPHIIRKKANDDIVYKQQIAVRYLQPPTPPPMAPLIIREIRQPALPALPPVIIRQRPVAPKTPPPLIIREYPPLPPKIEPSKVITKQLPPEPPLPRTVILERLPQLPAKPPPIIVERWLPYKQQKRRVLYEKAPPLPPMESPRNLIIQWDSPPVRVLKEVRPLGVLRTDPNKYVQQYGEENLKSADSLPQYIQTLLRSSNENNQDNEEQQEEQMISRENGDNKYEDNVELLLQNTQKMTINNEFQLMAQDNGDVAAQQSMLHQKYYYQQQNGSYATNFINQASNTNDIQVFSNGQSNWTLKHPNENNCISTNSSFTSWQNNCQQLIS